MEAKLVSIELQPRALSQSPLDDVPLPASPAVDGKSSRLRPQCLRAKGTIERWKKTLYMGCMATLVVLGFNLGFMLWAVTHLGLEGGRGLLFSGACDQTKKISTGFHLLINLLGTTMLAAGNYGMQCLCAPTRRDIDLAHSEGRWLDVGVQSMRNLWRIPRKKLALWVCLALSSLPLHLVYNATIFQSVASYEYSVFVGNMPFSSYNESAAVRLFFPPWMDFPPPSFSRLREKSSKGELQLLSNRDCINTYAADVQTKYGSLLLVADDFNSTDYDFALTGSKWYDNLDPYNWMCTALETETSPCSRVIHQVDPENWTIKNELVEWIDEIIHDLTMETDTVIDPMAFRVQYCLAETLPEKCTVEYSLPLVIVVILVNLIKAATLWATTASIADSPILTTGDAIASFLRHPDATTHGQSLLSQDNVLKPSIEPLTYCATPRRWGSPVSLQRWISCFLLFLTSIIVCIVLLVYGLRTINDGENPWETGFGQLRLATLISGDWPTSLVSNAMTANTPQVVLSVLYFCANGIYTIMTLSSEWSDYAIERKGLRVSVVPRGSQRSTYFLSLPYRYSLPLMVCSGLLHWLISQSLFLVSITSYASDFNRNPVSDTSITSNTSELTRNPTSDITTCGYSPMAILTTLSLGLAMFASLGGLAFKRFKSGMPVAGSCSLAIAAACHPVSVGEGDEVYGDITAINVTEPLKWGVEEFEDTEVGHCTFSNNAVQEAQHGRMYE
ncbi:hypothetical protein ATEIFO6365_0006076000 [Aspergillus terreus]|uniref:DUF6536 domain-containing protein n=1 Tax=Aspergillus terreus TaxID=33178 RepID=A0A5M3Z2E1_ASPTE|nr:hypothetical protein ATETN484_0005076000 [Aspergillus terreus]GFF17412.1 hypothetical protein ATEIFO6365_0006076000 [Aspergillus terreus]